MFRMGDPTDAICYNAPGELKKFLLPITKSMCCSSGRTNLGMWTVVIYDHIISSQS